MDGRIAWTHPALTQRRKQRLAPGVMFAPKVRGKLLPLPVPFAGPLHPGAVMAPSPGALIAVDERTGVVLAGDPA